MWDGQDAHGAVGRQAQGAHLAVVAPGDSDAVGGRGQIHEVGEVDGSTGPLGFHTRLIGGVVTLRTKMCSTPPGPIPTLRPCHPAPRLLSARSPALSSSCG